MRKLIVLRHKSCHGSIKEDWSTVYDYEDSRIPAYRCRKCQQETSSDDEVEFRDLKANKSIDYR